MPRGEQQRDYARTPMQRGEAPRQDFQRAPQTRTEQGRTDYRQYARPDASRGDYGRTQPRQDFSRYDYQRPAVQRDIAPRRENAYTPDANAVNPGVPEILATGECMDGYGVLELHPEGYGFLRAENCLPGNKDVYVSIAQIRRFNLRTGDYVVGKTRPQREGDRYNAMIYISEINGEPPEKAAHRKPFESLVPIYPDERLRLEDPDGHSDMALRLIDMLAPIGKGQRGMIVSQPKAGKTTLLKKIANAITHNYPDVHLIVLLIDERPEEVTDMKRSINGEVIYSTFDEAPENHTRVSEMVFERAQRLVEYRQRCGGAVGFHHPPGPRLQPRHSSHRTLAVRRPGPGSAPQAQALLWRGPQYRKRRQPYHHRYCPGGNRQPYGRHHLRGVQGHRQYGTAP